MNLTRSQWPDGWIPSDDSVNGRPTGLLRMDNLIQDENGVLSLCKGTVDASPEVPFAIHSVYSKVINSTKYRFIGRTDATVQYTTDNVNYTELLNGGSATRASFTSALGHVFCFSGNARKKFDGTNITNITPDKPSAAPEVQEAAKNDFMFWDGDFTNFTMQEGTNLDNTSNYLQFDTAETVGMVTITPPTSWDTNTLGAGGVGTEDDLLTFYIRVEDTRYLSAVRIIFNLTDTYDPLTDYFWYEWVNTSPNSPFNYGLETTESENWSVLKVLRKNFNREGANESLGWSGVYSIRFIITTSQIISIRFNFQGLFFSGYNENPLNGSYEYIQVNVNNTGSYLARSVPSVASTIVTPVNGRVQITPCVTTDPQVNEMWFYRRDAAWNQDVREISEPRRLDRWYRVKILEDPFPVFEDYTSDDDALLEGVTIQQGLESVTYYTDDEIMKTSDLFNGRLFLMGIRDIYITTEDDFGLYSPLWTIRLSGDATEKNIWIKKVSTNVIIIGTTYDVYELSGTCEELPDGTLDMRITPLGLEYPPIHEAVIEEQGIVYYVAADGVRALNGGASMNISLNLQLLFQDQTRHGVLPINVQVNNLGTFGLAISKGKLWFLAKLSDDSRRLFIFDINKKNWTLWEQDPWAIYVEEDDTLLGGYGDTGNNKLKELYSGTATAQNVQVITIYDDNGQPRNRKDVFTLKITADTGNTAVDVYISKDEGGWSSLGTLQCNGVEEKLYTLATVVPLGFRYALKLEGSGLTTFKLFNYTIEYNPRPEQLTYYRIDYTNLGTYSRKRFTNFAFVIDTLGNAITFTPLVDNNTKSTSVANLDRKGTYIHYFLEDTTGTDIGGILSGGTFEYYNLNLEETVSEKLPTPVKYLVIPADDYGNPNRKRHSSYKFSIHTRGASVRFTPRIDGVNYAPLDFSTSEKRIVEYFFSVDTIGIDIGGVLESLADTPFEFYGRIVPQDLEVLPPRLKEFRIPENNYGVPAKKRVRTMPMVINTNGSDVTFTPIVDNVAQTPSTINTATKCTALHYFTDDQFGIDFSGELIGVNPFEFYGLERPVDVEIIPVGKKFDQVGPIEFDRLGKFIGFRVEMIATGTSLPYVIYMQDDVEWTGTIVTVPNKHQVYEVMRLPKTIAGTILRIEFGPAEVFHRYYCEVQVNIGGEFTDKQVFKIR